MAWMAVAAACIVAMNALIKLATADLPETVVLFFRMAFAIPMLLPLALWSGVRGLATRRLGAHLMRALVGTAGMAAYVFAIAGMELAEFVTVTFTRALWVPLVAWLMLGERLTRHRAIAALVGFAGIVAMARPQLAFNPALVIAILGEIGRAHV